MAYDMQRGRTVLFGGVQAFPATWEWDGTSWMKRSSAVMPWRGALAYDVVRGRTVLFGATAPKAPETWEWDGNTSPGTRSTPFLPSRG